jgi:sugar-specific transcriptional regulator TrmB
MLKNNLEMLGLGDYEAQIYEILLGNSPASASLLAKKANLSRSSVYTTLGSLVAKGLVGTTYKNEVKQFIAQGFSPLQAMVSEEKKQVDYKVKLLEKLQNEINLLTNKNLNIPQIIFFEGQEGLKKIYKSMLREAANNDTMYILRDEFVWRPEWQFIFQAEWHSRVRMIKKEKNIQTKLLINGSKLEKQKKAFYATRKNTEYQYLPTNNSVQQFAIYITGDIVSILSMESNNLVGIKITNQHLANNFKIIFNNLWKK